MYPEEIENEEQYREMVQQENERLRSERDDQPDGFKSEQDEPEVD